MDEQERNILDFDYSRKDYDPNDSFGLTDFLSGSPSSVDLEKTVEQALTDRESATQKIIKQDNEDLRKFAKFHRDYLKSQNIPTDNVSDKRILTDLSQRVANEGQLNDYPILKNVLIRDRQEKARDNVFGDGAAGNLYFLSTPFQGLEKGTYMAGGMTAGTVGAIGDFTGISTPGSDSIAESLMREAGRSGGPVKSLRDGTVFQGYTFDFDENGNLTGGAQGRGSQIQNTIDFGLNAIGEVIPTMGAIMLSGLAGGAVASSFLKVAPRVLQKKVVGKALSKEINRVTKSGSLLEGKSKLSPYRTALLGDRGKAYAALGTEGQKVANAYASAWGNVLGAAGASGTMGVGEVYNSLIPYTRLPKSHAEHIDVDDAVGYSLLFGGAIGGLDAIMPSKVGGTILRKFYPKKSKIGPVDIARADNMARKGVIKAMTMGMAVEGTTEAAQEFLNMTAEKFAKARQVGDEGYFEDLGESVSFDFTDDEMWQLLDAGALGLVGGAGAGGAFALIDNKYQLPKRLKQKQEYDDAVETARLRNKLLRTELRQELEDKAKAQFERKTLAEGDSVILPNGQEATFIRVVGDGRGLVTYTDPEGKARQVSLAMPLITLNSDLKSNVVTRANRRTAMQNVDLLNPPQATDTTDTTDTTSIVDEFKADAPVAQESTEDDAEEIKEKKPEENTKAKFRDTPVEGVDNLTKGDELAYTLLEKGGIYDKSITTERLIDGEITDGLKSEIDTTLYNSWWKNTYDTRFESQPSKGAMIEAFRRAHKIKHPTGRPTQGDILAEQTKAQADQAQQQKIEEQQKEQEARLAETAEKIKNARLVNLGKKNYQEGDKIRITQARANNAAQYIPERSLGVEFTVDSVDNENGVVTITDGQGGTYRADPRDFTSPIRKKQTKLTVEQKAGRNEGFSDGSIEIILDERVTVTTSRSGEDSGEDVTTIKVKTSNGKFVGSITTAAEVDGYKGISIAIAENYRGKGLSKHLYNLALADAKAEGLKGLYSVDNILKTPDKSKASRKNFKTSQLEKDSPMRDVLEERLHNELKGKKNTPITLITDVSDSFAAEGATPYSQETNVSAPKDVPAFRKEKVKTQGKDMDALPELKNGTYVVQFGPKKSIIDVEDDTWKFKKGSLSGDNAARPKTFGELIQRAKHHGIANVTSVRYEDEYIINVNFDGVSFNFQLSKSAPNESKKEPIPISNDEDNGQWLFQGQSTDTLDPAQTHLKVREINKIEGDQKGEEVLKLTEYKATKKIEKGRTDLPGENLNPSGNQSNAVIAVLHKPTGQVFVRSVKKSKGTLSIYKFRKPRTDGVSGLPSANSLDYNKLPSEFQPLEVVLFSARPGTLRLNLKSEQEYRNWIDSIPAIESRQIKRDPSNNPRANELLDEFAEDGEDAITDEFDLYFEVGSTEDGEVTYFTDPDTGDLIIDEAIGAYIPATGRRRTWHYLKVSQITEQLDVAVEPTLQKIDEIIKDKKRGREDLNDDIEVLAGHINFLRFGEGTEDENGNSQIDTGTLQKFFNKEEKKGRSVITNGNKQYIAQAYVNALYQQKKRQVENEVSSSQETSLGINPSGGSVLENIRGQDQSPLESAVEKEIDALIKDLDFEGREAIAIGKLVFFPNFTNEQLRIVHQAGQSIDVEATREEIIQQLGLQNEALKNLTRVAPEERGMLTTVHDMLANSDAFANPNSPDETAISAAVAGIKYLGGNFTPEQIDEQILKTSPVVNLEADQAFNAEVEAYKKLIDTPVRNLFEPALRNVDSEIELTGKQKELLSIAYSSILKSVRLPSESTSLIQDAFMNIAEAFQGNGTQAFSRMEDARTVDIFELKEKVFSNENVELFPEYIEQTLDVFFEYLKSVKGQVLKENKGHYTMLMHEHLGFADTPLILPQSGFEKQQLETGAIDNVTSPPNKPPIENMQDPIGGQSFPIMEEVSEQSIKHADTIARAQKTNLVQPVIVSDEQRAKNQAAMEEVFPSNLPGSNLSAVALESINEIINKEGTEEGKVFGGELVKVLTELLESRSGQGLPSIRFDNTTPLDAEPGYHTRGQFFPDFERPTVFINPDFYMGDNDGIGEPFPITGNKEKDIVMLVAMHELWHGTMEESLHAHEAKIARGELSELQETIDLIDEVIDVARQNSANTKFSSLFIKANADSRREILNRAWNRRDFAEFLSGIQVSSELQQRIDKNGKGFINNLLDALYAAYLKLLKAIGIDTDGTALKALLDLNRQLDARHRILEPQSNTYEIPPDALAAMEDKNNKLPDTDKVSQAGQIGVDKKQLIALLGPTMYNSPIDQVAVKELLQNSFDAVKTRINLTKNKSAGKIDIFIDRPNRIIRFTDDGMGMTADIVKNAFLNIGGTNKEGLELGERSGGFGLAKVQFLLGSDYVKVTTVRDGEMTEIDATADQLYNDNFEITTSKTDKENGTVVELQIPRNYTTATGETKDISFFYDQDDIEALHKPLIGNVDVSIKFREYETYEGEEDETTEDVVEIGNNQNLPPLFTNVTFDWGTAEVYISEEKISEYAYPKHEVLSSGVYQFDKRFPMNPKESWGDSIPYDIIVNIKPNVATNAEQYPFNNQREDFKPTVEKDIDALKFYLAKFASGEADKAAQQRFGDIMGLPKIDPDGVLTEEERAKLFGEIDSLRQSNEDIDNAENELRGFLNIRITTDNTSNRREITTKKGKKIFTEKDFKESFKAEQEIEKAPQMDIGTYNPAQPQYHNNTTFDYTEIEGAIEFFSDIGSVVHDLVRFAGSNFGGSYDMLKSTPEKKYFAGISIDKSYGGVHVSSKTGSLFNAVFINPLSFNPRNKEEAAGVMLHITLHEIAHTLQKNEGAGFTSELARVYGKMYAKERYGYYEGLFRSVFTRHFNTYKNLVRKYDKLSTKNIADSFKGSKVEGFNEGVNQGDASDVRSGELSEEGSRGDTGSLEESGSKTGEIIQSQLGFTDAELIRARTRTHISIEPFGFAQGGGYNYKVTGLAQDEVLTAIEIREGLVRFKAMPSRVGVLKLNKNGKPIISENGFLEGHKFHVTFTKNIPNIKENGITGGLKSNWKKQGTGEAYGAGKIFAMDNFFDAIKWATEMEWKNNSSMGDGVVSIVIFKDGETQPSWDLDNDDVIATAGNEGNWLRRKEAVESNQIIGHTEVDMDTVKIAASRRRNPDISIDFHLFREGTETELVPASELEAYNAEDVSEMTDQMDFNFEGKVDNSLNYIVIENASTDLQKGQILPKHKANRYRGVGVMFKRYDEYLKEKEAGETVIEDIPDVAYKESAITANQTLVKFLAYYFPWGSNNLQDYADLEDRAFKRLGIPRHRIRKEIDSIENLFALTPNKHRDKFQWLAFNRGLKVPPSRIGDFMSDPTVSPAQGLQGNVMPEENSKALAKATAAGINESSIAVAYAAQQIRRILDNPDLSVDEIWSTFLKGKTPTKKLNELIKQYGEEMEYQTIEIHKNSENTRDQARVEALKRIENQIKHVLKQSADIDSDLDPMKPGSIESRIAKLEERTILDEAHLFDRSKYGDEIRNRIDSYASTTAQAIVEETGEEETDIILNAYRNITGKAKTDDDFNKALDRVMSSSRGGGIAPNKIADLILEVSKVSDIQALDAEAIYKIIEPNFNNQDRAIILSAVMADRKDLIYLAKLSQSTDIKGRRDLNAKLQSLSRATLNELKVLDSPNSNSYFPVGNQFEKDIQSIFVKDRIDLLKAQEEKENAIKKQMVYQELFNEFDVESKRLMMLLGHNPAKQINDGDKFPVMTKVNDEYVMSEITVQMSNLMQFENFDELKTAIALNKKYLREREGKEDNDYRYVKQMVMNAEIMPIWTAQYETAGMFRLHSLKSARERFQTAGTLGRQIAQMILQFENGYRRYTPQIRAFSRTWNEAFNNARKQFGYTEGHLFMDEVIGPVIKWNEDQPQLSGDREAFQKGAWKYASGLVPDGQLTENAESALNALWNEYERSADFQRGIATDLGLKVVDEKTKLRDPMGRPFDEGTKDREPYGTYLFRDAITRGYLTVPRLLRSDYIQAIVTEMPKYGWATEISDNTREFSWKYLDDIMKSKELDQATKAQQVEDASNILVNDYIWNKFMVPYIKNTSPRELFDQPKKGLKIPRSQLMLAWEATVGKTGAEAFNTWIEVLYNNLGTGKKDRSDFVQFKYNILKTYKNRFNRLKHSVRDMGKQGVSDSISLAGHLMDSRSQDAIIPIEFLRYTTYDEVTSPALLARTLENVYFGRNAEKLKNALDQLAGSNGEMTVKMQKFRSLASYVGAIPNPSGKQSFTRQQRAKAYIELETNPEFENIPGKTGKEKFDNLKNNQSIMKSVFGSEVGEGAQKHLNAYFNGDLGPFQDEKMFYELLGLNAYFVLNQPKSGVTNLMSIWDFDAKYGGMGKSAISAQLFGSWTAASEILGGIMANFGVDIGTKSYESDILMPLFFNTYENDLGFRRAALNVGSGAVKKGVLFGKDFRYDMLRPFKALLDYDPRRGAKVKNEEGRRKYAPFSTRTLFLKPFSYFGALSNHSIAVANARMVSKLVHEVATHIEQVNAIQAETGQGLLPEDYQVTSEELGKKLSDKIAYDRLNLDLEVYGLGSISNLARDYLDRKSKGDNRILTKEQVIVSGFIGQNEVALEGGFATTPAMLNSKYMRWAAPLQKWALNKVKQMNESPRDVKTGKLDAQAALLMLANIIALKIPIGLAYAFFWSDWYDEELLGKASPLRPLPKEAMIPLIGPFVEGDPANNLKAMLERVARAGNVGGMALDFANTMYNGMDTYSYNRGFTLDSRILLASQATNIGQALRNWVHMDFSVDYANVTRPLLYSMGANGVLQQFNLFSNYLGIDSEERRISTQIGNRHKLRAGIHTLGIESRPMIGGSIGKTRFSAAIRRMERAALADDYKGFNQAYGEAINASIDRGDDDPENVVIQAFKRRNLRTGISRYKLSDEEWNGILNLYEKEAAQSLIDSMNAHDKYVDILDASKPKKKKIQPQQQLQPATYDELIRRSLSF